MLAAPELSTRLRKRIQDVLPHVEALSIILLHVSQIEPPPIVSPAGLPPRRRRHHAPDSFLDQLVLNMRRVVRGNDQILLQPGSGAALLLPHVDAQGAYRVLERIYHSLDLLQAETVVPPLARETTILLGSGSYPEQCRTPERLLAATATIAHRLTLRPALVLDQGSLPSSSIRDEEEPARKSGEIAALQSGTTNAAAPFMHLPEEIPHQLRQLIPYHLAQKLQCAPVGRDQQRLTVAMVHPGDREAIHTLAELTGMTIFPVSCEERALNMLLERQW